MVQFICLKAFGMLYTWCCRGVRATGRSFHRARNIPPTPTHLGQNKLKPIQTLNMKKTIIALMALSGMMFGASAYGMTATEAQEALTDAITDSGYTIGDSYSFSVEITDMSNGDPQVITLGTGAYLKTQYGNFLGLGYNNTNPSNWATVDTDGVDKSAKTITMTLQAPAAAWFSYGLNGDGTTTNGSYNLDGSTLNIDFDSESTTTTITLTRADSVKDILVVKKFNLKATDIVINDSPAFANVTFTSTPAIPEPTTATLSLLALAGLAARRRRK